MRKILIIARYFIPYYRFLGEIIRILKIAEFFIQNGIGVDILCAKGEIIDYFGYREQIS